MFHNLFSLKTAIRNISLILLGFTPLTLRAGLSEEKYFGRWALELERGRAGWLEIVPQNGWYDGSLLWASGSVEPLASVAIVDGELIATRLRLVSRKGPNDIVLRKQQIAETLSGRLEGDVLKLTRSTQNNAGTEIEREHVTGRFIPAVGPAPDLSKIKWGEPIRLFNGRDLSGWRLIESKSESGWSASDGMLYNRPATHVAGQKERHFGNLRTEREFEDFNLKAEVLVPANSNSGIYLRGIYEIQIQDSYGKPLDSHNMGALYSRITPAVAAEKPASEWQTLDITLVDRHLSVVLNGVRIIANQPIAGCTGGALWADEFRPGPIYLQGDHGAVTYRNLVLTPVLK
jgi:hypothetical protein